MVKEKILSADFLYEQPYFYDNELAYRCELGQGESTRTYMKNARTRALEIFEILFPDKVDALFFHNYYCGYDYNSEDEDGEESIVFPDGIIKSEKEKLYFSIGIQRRYKHRKVRLRGIEALDNEDIIMINRIICDIPPKSDCKKYIKNQINCQINSLIHFVNYELNCIFSVYDDRGCDIVFFDKENYLKIYEKLQPYFLDYDLSLINERVQKAKEL